MNELDQLHSSLRLCDLVVSVVNYRLGSMCQNRPVRDPPREFALDPVDRCLQYRAVFVSDNGDRYPILDRVEIRVQAAP